MTGKKPIFKFILCSLSNFILCSLSILILSSCATGAYISEDFDYPILDIQTSVADNLPEGVGATNVNRRVFYSNKFTVKQENKGKIPLVMRVVINSDRRPYGLEVEIRRVSPDNKNMEEAFNLGNDFKGQNSLAKRVVTRVKDQLAQRRKSKNIFDDFKAF
jgi:hypothetical protein